MNRSAELGGKTLTTGVMLLKNLIQALVTCVESENPFLSSIIIKMKTDIENTAQLHSSFSTKVHEKHKRHYLYIPACIVFKMTQSSGVVHLHKSCTNIYSVCYEKCPQWVFLCTSEVLRGIESQDEEVPRLTSESLCQGCSLRPE